MTYGANPATKAGPNSDGSKSLARESKLGIATAFGLTILANGALEWLTQLDTEAWSGRWSQIGVAAVATAIGLITAWKARNH